MKQICNPIFPLNEYIPDGEPHVFGDRVYLYGSHDKELGDRFCMLDYTVWSAPVDDLSDWTNHGVSYKKSQDKRATAEKLPDYYAPDCVKGNDGRYYLYYSAMGPNVRNFGPLSVAVSDSPAGPFEYLGDIRYPDGTPVLKFMNNDPAVLNDNGRIWLYYGWGLGRDFRSKIFKPIYDIVLSKIAQRSIKEVRETKPSILSCAVVELCDDMLTVKSEPKAVLDSKTTADKNSELYHHAFYEAPSIRKIGDTYYLVYSSGENNELAYATGKHPDRDFKFGGVIISNSDLGLDGNKVKKNNAGTIHGGIECINGRWYVFYHRCTNNTDFSRQACAEPIEILPDGSIKQVEITTGGLNPAPLGKGKFPAAICCHLYNPTIKAKKGNGNVEKYPCVTCKDGERIITSVTDGTVIGYKYFDLTGVSVVALSIRGDEGRLYLGFNEENMRDIALDIEKSSDWKIYRFKINKNGKQPLYFIYKGKGRIEAKELIIE